MKRPDQRTISKVEDLQREIQRLRDAKRRALSAADERAKEANGLWLENERLRTLLAERDRS